MKMTHENKVERFYSHGSRKRGSQEGGYLSFGFWADETEHYHQAVEALINKILQFEKPLDSGMALNVACGYGAETVKIYEKIRPSGIIAIDITEAHIAYAKHQIELLKLSDRIRVEKMDACKLNFPPDYFNYIISIEGPAHFNTREIFLRKAYKLLKPGGILLLSDIVANMKETNKNLYNRIIGRFCAKHWHMPKANWISIKEMNSLLKRIGFEVDILESIGNYVFPGFSKYNLRWGSIKNAIQTRGFTIGLALTFISWLLGYVHRKNMIDYVFVRALKI
ncbi:MAG: methyltransferase domain-containing protein [Bacteroidales bacterium]|nr:methyltransferase domain-containing protein [Bacteroidales bacterium]